MGSIMLIACLYLALVAQTTCYPLRLFKSISARSNPDAPGWIWNWAWGSESTVSIVDRTPPLSFPSRPASFGAELEDPLLGYVIPVSSFTEPCRNVTTNASAQTSTNTGCPDLCLIDNNQPTETWIALVQRGSCDFAAKVREAQRLGAKAVVVGGEDPDISGFPDVLLTMYSTGDASDIHISSTYIRHSDYITLSTLIESSNTSHSGLRTLSLLISTEYSAWEWYSPIITFIIILLLPSLLTFMTLLIHRIRANRQAQRDRAPEDVVKHLPWSVWTGTGWEKHGGDEDPHAEPPPSDAATSGDVESSSSGEHGPIPSVGLSSPIPPPNPPPTAWFEAQMECAICLCEFVKGDKVRVLPCHHIFHLDEVDEWLIQRKKLCPVCKADVTQPRPADEPSSNSSNSTPSRTTPSETTPLLGDDSV